MKIDDIIIKLQQRWKLSSPFELLGTGSYGSAYSHPHPQFKNKIFKLTTDSGEVQDCKRLMRVKNPYFVKIYKIFKIESSELDESTWLLIKEKIEPLNQIERLKYNRVFELHMLKRPDADIRKYYTVIAIPEKYIDMIVEMGKMVKAVYKYTKKPDLHAFNVGHRKSYPKQFVYLDAGSYDDDNAHKDVDRIDINESKKRRIKK